MRAHPQILAATVVVALLVGACGDDAPSFDAGATTTTPSTTSTTIVGAPVVTITSPDHLTPLWADVFDEGCGCAGVWVTLAGVATDPEGDDLTAEWSSSRQGVLLTDFAGSVFLTVRDSDTARHVITLRVTDATGASAAASVEVIVSIPSDTG